MAPILTHQFPNIKLDVSGPNPNLSPPAGEKKDVDDQTLLA
jgi:hypothetical protein